MKIEITREELNKRNISLFLGLPAYGGNCAAIFARSIADLSALCTNYGIKLQMYFLMNESLVQRARNYICDEFMRSDSEYLMFIDSDIGFSAQDVIALLILASNPDSPYDVIGGPYPKKNISWEKIKRAVDKGVADKNPQELDNYVGDFVFNPKGGSGQISIVEPAEVLEIGTGFMLIRKNIMKKFQEAFPLKMYRPDHVRTEHFDGTREICAFFDCEIDRKLSQFNLMHLVKRMTKCNTIEEYNILNAEALKLIEEDGTSGKRYLSEDYWFCQRIQEIGGKIWLCPWMKLQHVGSMIYGGSLAHLASIGAAATADVGELKKPKK